MADEIKLERYKIEKYLGSGAFADVYRALDTQLNRVVALKVLKAVYRGDEDVSRFRTEAQAAAALTHQHIAWVWDLGEENGHFYITIRYVEGQSLDKLIHEKGRLPWKYAVQYMKDIGSALSFAHGMGLIHRDIKPQNILISADSGAVLTDFGLAKAMTDSGLRSRSGGVVGTPQYIAPEIWNGEPAGPAADQYALACVMVEMLTGTILYQSSSLEAIVKKHFAGPYEHWIPLPEAPAGADKVIRKALCQIPKERYAHVCEFIQALQMLGMEIEQKPDTRILRRNPIPVPPTPSEVPKPSAPNRGPASTRPLDSSSANPVPPPDRRSATEDIPTSRISSGMHKIGKVLGVNISPEGKTNCYLQVGTGRNAKTVNLTRKVISIGRERNNDIAVPDSDVSRYHARFVNSGGGTYRIEDLKSSNGTYVNGKRVTSALILKDGDRIRLGTHFECVYQEK